MQNEKGVAAIERMSGINATRVADYGEISASGLRLSGCWQQPIKKENNERNPANSISHYQFDNNRM